MGPLNPNWSGIAKTLFRGPHTTEPSDPQYVRSFDVVPGSLSSPTDDLLIGSFEPQDGQGRVGVPANLRISGDTVFIDRMILPEPAANALKPISWIAEHRSVEPSSFPLADLEMSTAPDGTRRASIPDALGGGAIYERPNAYRGRINDASAAEQIEALKGWFSRPRWRSGN